MASVTVADLVVGCLRDAGVRALFGVPGGGSNLDLIAAAGHADLPFVLTATETAGAIAALAQAEITGTPGACLTTLGPGAASVVNGVACTFLDRAPVIVFTDSHPAAAAACDHQRLDHAALLTPVTKWSATLTPDTTLEVVERAIHQATEGRPGPVHIDCPGDVLSASALAAGAGTHARLVTTAVRRSRVEDLVAASRKPLLLVGLGARSDDDAAAIRALCSRRHVPALVTYKAKGVVPDDHPWFAGVLTNGVIERPVIDDSDLLIAIGLDPIELIPRPWTHRQPIVSLVPWRVENTHVPFAQQIEGDIPAGLTEVDAALHVSDWDPARVRALVAAQREAIDIRAEGMTAQQVVETAATKLAAVAAHVTVDAGAHMFPATMLWPVREPNGMLISNGLSTMGFALPAAIGAALLDRERPVVVLTGDGGLLMCAGELLTAVRERLRIITIVFNDASLSLIEIKQQARALPPAGVALGGVDWRTLASSMGVTAWTASTTDELASAIDEASAISGPALIEARIDRSNYGATLRAIRG
jgi:acetolactate synthase-1/2/3 large subunit